MNNLTWYPYPSKCIEDDYNADFMFMFQIGYRLSDRILDIKRELKVGLDLGCGRGYVAKNITDVSAV